MTCETNTNTNPGGTHTLRARLLDPPLHEFLPDGDLDEIVALLASDTGASEDEVVDRQGH